MEKTSHGAWFLGPKAEQQSIWEQFIVYILHDHTHWRKNYFPSDSVVISRSHIRKNEPWIDNMSDELDKILAAFKSNNPNHSPRYLAHMVSEQTLPSVVGYFAGMLYNSNNVSGESSPIAVPMELEVGKMLATMLGYDGEKAWTHLTSGGTVANIEAMWVARTIKFVPFIIREFCERHNIDFMVTTPNGQSIRIQECENRVMLGLRSRDAVFMVRDLTRWLVEQCSWQLADAIAAIADVTKHSKYNIIKEGLHTILNRLGVEPVILVSPSAHYSIKKAANLLGYGERAVRLVEVDSNFRLNVAKLQEAVENLSENEYIAAVIAIAGTTEEGAIDPIHKIVEVRSELEQQHNRSFWLHIDSAWGGYIRTLFCGYKVENTSSAKEYRSKINSDTVGSTKEKIWEHDPEIYLSLMNFSESDSITIDPHKLGYTPYPAGVVSFKHSVVVEHIKQEAPYVFIGEMFKDYNAAPDISEVGSYILEGSKPGATAASCYLAHKTIPLTLYGHGKIIKASLQSTIRLQRLMESHLSKFEQYELKAAEKMKIENIPPSTRRFTIIPLHKADSNLICFVVRPVTENGEVDGSMCLHEANKFNERIFVRMGIDHKEILRSSTTYDYFVSKTAFRDSVYGYSSIEPVLSRLKISEQEYKEHGLYVLRTTIMNPFYPLAARGGKDYLDEYVACIHANACAEL